MQKHTLQEPRRFAPASLSDAIDATTPRHRRDRVDHSQDHEKRAAMFGELENFEAWHRAARLLTGVREACCSSSGRTALFACGAPLVLVDALALPKPELLRLALESLAALTHDAQERTASVRLAASAWCLLDASPLESRALRSAASRWTRVLDAVAAAHEHRPTPRRHRRHRRDVLSTPLTRTRTQDDIEKSRIALDALLAGYAPPERNEVYGSGISTTFLTAFARALAKVLAKYHKADAHVHASTARCLAILARERRNAPRVLRALGAASSSSGGSSLLTRAVTGLTTSLEALREGGPGHAPDAPEVRARRPKLSLCHRHAASPPLMNHGLHAIDATSALVSHRSIQPKLRHRRNDRRRPFCIPTGRHYRRVQNESFQRKT